MFRRLSLKLLLPTASETPCASGLLTIACIQDIFHESCKRQAYVNRAKLVHIEPTGVIQPTLEPEVAMDLVYHANIPRETFTQVVYTALEQLGPGMPDLPRQKGKRAARRCPAPNKWGITVHFVNS